MGGGIMNAMPREKYGLGSSLKKAVKKVTKGVKDIASSDIGKAALTGAILFGIPGMGATGGIGGGLLGRASFGGAAPGVFGIGGIGNLFAAGAGKDLVKKEAAKSLGLKKTLGIGAVASIFGGAFAGKSEEEIEAITRDTNALKNYLTQYYTNLNPELRNQPLEKVEEFVNSQIAEYNEGRGGYAAGGDTASDNAMQAAGIEGLPMRENPKGIKELDLRETGGFIQPVGIKEKADDIPAMLSNNEFVFTADAVRGMGDGDVNKGAERMYNMMKTLEERRKSLMAEVQTVRQAPAEFIEAAAKTYLDDLTKAVGGFKTTRSYLKSWVHSLLLVLVH